MYHEMAHVFQWHVKFKCPFGLLEGIADYVMIKSGSYNMSYPYTNPGAGKRWDEGYGVTERFLEYFDSLLPSFTDINTREQLSSLRYCLRIFPMLE